MEPSDVVFFTSIPQLREWLDTNHGSTDVLWAGFYKKASAKQSVDWSEVVDTLLCFGWIDGLRKRFDDDSFVQRLTPRRRGSNWSAVNLAKVERLQAAGLMQPAGIAAWQARLEGSRGRNSNAQRQSASSATGSSEEQPAGSERESLTPLQRRSLKQNHDAWAFWQEQPPGYRKQAATWVRSAKKEETRERRLATLIDDCAAGLRIKPLRRNKK